MVEELLVVASLGNIQAVNLHRHSTTAVSVGFPALAVCVAQGQHGAIRMVVQRMAAVPFITCVQHFHHCSALRPIHRIAVAGVGS